MENENATEMLISEPKPLTTMQLVLKAQLTPDSPLARAVAMFTNRHDRTSHPDGEFNQRKRWTPSVDERRPCCDSIHHLSAARPYSLLVHCRTAAHLSEIFNVDLAELKRVARALEKMKAVAAA